MQVEDIKKITDLIEVDMNLAVSETNKLTLEEQKELFLYVIDNLYPIEADIKLDMKINGKIIKFCRRFRPVMELLNAENNTVLLHSINSFVGIIPLGN